MAENEQGGGFLTRFIFNPLTWVAAAAVGVAAFFLGRNSTPAPASVTPPQVAPNAPAQPGNGEVYRTGTARNSIYNPSTRAWERVEESAANFSSNGAQYRITGIINSQSGAPRWRQYHVHRASDGQNIDTRAISLSPDGGRIVVNENQFATDVRNADTERRPFEFVPARVVSVENVVDNALPATVPANARPALLERMRTVTLEGQYGGQTIRRRIIISTNGSIVGAYGSNNRPVFDNGAIGRFCLDPEDGLVGYPMNISITGNNENIRTQMQDFISNQDGRLRIANALRILLSDSNTNFDQLSHANPNANLPRLGPNGGEIVPT